MSKRPIAAKKLNRFRKAMRKELPRQLDLVQWLVDHGHADTTGAAQRLILARRVRSESHPVGVEQIPTLSAEGKIVNVDVVQRYVPASTRSTLCVVSE